MDRLKFEGLCALGLLMTVATAAAAAPVSRARRGWRFDLQLLASTLSKRHANAFHHISRKAFVAEVAELDRRIERLTPDQFFVGLDRIENSIGDGHTYMRIPPGAPAFGVSFKRFGTDYRLVAIAPSLDRAGLLGARLLSVDGISAPEVHRRLLELTPADETFGLREDRAERLLSNGLVLHGLDVLRRRDRAHFILQSERGRRIQLVAKASPALYVMSFKTVVHFLPVSQQHSSTGFYCVPLKRGKVTYCNFRSYKSLSTTSKQVWNALPKSGGARLVLDLRDNRGGDFCEGLKYLVRPIQARPDINRDGHLFVLIGSSTFSAAMSNASHFRTLTHAILVGGPIGEKPNSFQEAEDIKLPHTGWIGRYSTRFYRFADGPENLIRPDVSVSESWDDYRLGRDRALSYVLALATSAVVRTRRGRPNHAVAVGEEYCNA